MKSKIIPYNKQSINDSDIKMVTKFLKSDFLTTGPQCLKFESQIAKYVGSKYAVACSSGTAAIHLALMALDVSKGDSVLTSANTFVADANSILQVDAKVLFADIDQKTANICLDEVEKILAKSSKIKAIIPIHFAGYPVDMKQLKKICLKYKVKIIEDGCHALGGKYMIDNKSHYKIGSCKYSDITTFSFHAIKNITTGEGGALTTNNKKIYKKLLILRTHGITRNHMDLKNNKLSHTRINKKKILNPWYYEMQYLSHNYRMTDFQAGLGQSQLLRLNRFIKKRRSLAKKYKDEFNKYNNKHIQLYKNSNEENIHAFHLFCIKVDFSVLKGGRTALMKLLNEKGISTQVHYIPIYKFPYYKKYFSTNYKLKNTETHYKTTLSIPLFFDMSTDMPKKIVKTFINLFESIKKNK